MSETKSIQSNSSQTNNSLKTGLVVAELLTREKRTSQKGETYYILEISIRRAITDMVLELRKEENLIKTNGKEPLFVFTNEGKNKFAYTLEIGCIYAFWFVKRYSQERDEEFYNVKDWRKLSSDKRSIERTLRLVLGRKDEEEDNEEVSNKELLLELEKRIKTKRISFKLSAVNSDSDLLDIDTDLRDNESNLRVNLQDKEISEETK